MTRLSPRHVFVALALLALNLAAGLAWLSLDARPDQGLCCGLVPELRNLAAALEGEGPPWWRRPGWAQGLGLPGLALGRADGPLLGMLASALALQAAQGAVAARLAGPGAGLLAMALAPMVPLLALAQRRFDAFAPQMALIGWATWAALASRGLTRPGPTLAFGALTFLTFTSSPHPTDNYLAVLALGGLAGGAWLRTLALGRDADGQPAPRGQALALGPALLLCVALTLPIAPSLSDGGSLLGAGYYLAEVDHGGLPAHHPRALAAYAVHLFWRGFGPGLGWALALGALAWLARGRGRAELLGLILPLGLTLSLLGKKNVYYLAPAWPALALMPALGVAALPPRVRPLATLLVLGAGGAQLAARAWPDAARGTPLAGRFAPRFDETLGGAFQTSDQGMDLAPRPPGPDLALFEALEAIALPAPGDCPHAMAMVGELPVDGWWLRAVSARPGLRLVNPPLDPVQDDLGLVVLGPPPGVPNPQERDAWSLAARWLAGAPGWEQAPGEGWTVFVREDRWWRRRCSTR